MTNWTAIEAQAAIERSAIDKTCNGCTGERSATPHYCDSCIQWARENDLRETYYAARETNNEQYDAALAAQASGADSAEVEALWALYLASWKVAARAQRAAHIKDETFVPFR